MRPDRTVLPLAALCAVLALTALTLVVLASDASLGEGMEIYELQQVSVTHGARAVAVRADGMEALVLESAPGSIKGYYNDTIFKLVGGALVQLDSFTDQSWYWTAAAYDPSSTLALLGGTGGVLYSYDTGSLTRLSFPQSHANINAIDWHPRSGYALIGSSSSTLYKYDRGTFRSMGNVGYWVDDIDFKPDGSEAALACYYYEYVLNTTDNTLTQLDQPVIDDYYYYYVHSVEYTRDGRYVCSAWNDPRGAGNAILRYSVDKGTSKWEKLVGVSGEVDRMVFETEGSFLLMGLQDNIYITDGKFAQNVPGWGAGAAAGGVRDIAINDRDFFFLFGNDNGVFELKRKANVKPWLRGDVEDASFNEDDNAGGTHLVNMLDYATDDRNPSKLRFEFEMQPDPSKLEGRVDGQYLDLVIKEQNWNGKLTFRVKFLDRGYDDIVGTADDMSNVTNFFNVTVRPVNDPIRLLKVGDKVPGQDVMVFFAEEGQWLNLTLDVFDVDSGETYRFSTNRSLPTLKVLPTADPRYWTLAFQPRNRDVGTIYLNLTVTDGVGSFDHVNLVINVRNVNNAPRLAGVKDMAILEDHWLNFTVWAVDEDIDIGIMDTLTFSTNRTDGVGGDDLPNLGFTVDPLSPTHIRVWFLPTNDNVGDVLVEFRVRDGFAMQGAWQDIRVMRIAVENTNDAPALVEVDGVGIGDIAEFPLRATEDQVLTITLLAHDDDRDPLTFYVNDPRFGVEQTAGAVTAKLHFTPGNDDVGSIPVVVSVWDNHNTFDELTLRVTVENVNDAPVITTFEAKDARGATQLSFTLWEGQSFIAPVLVSDPDSDNLTFSDIEGLFTITVDPSDSHRATFEWTPGQGDVGLHTTLVQVSDGDGGKATIGLSLEVKDINDQPSAATVTQKAFENPIPFEATQATDPEGNALTYTWDFGDFSPVATGDNLTHLTHVYARMGTYKLTLTVSDGKGGETVTVYDVLVQQSGKEPQAVRVQKGPVAAIAAITAAALAAAAAMIHLYSSALRKRGGGKA